AAIIAIIGAATIIEYGTGWDWHIDQIIFRDNAGPFPGRMAFPTALNFLFLGSSLLLIEKQGVSKRLPIKDLLALLAAFITLVAFFGFLYRAEPLFPVVPF